MDPYYYKYKKYKAKYLNIRDVMFGGEQSPISVPTKPLPLKPQLTKPTKSLPEKPAKKWQPAKPLVQIVTIEKKPVEPLKKSDKWQSVSPSYHQVIKGVK